MVTLDKALDDIMKLDFPTREMLFDILRNRVTEEKRKQIEEDAKKVQSSFRKGKLKKQPLPKLSIALTQFNGLCLFGWKFCKNYSSSFHLLT